MWPQDKVSLIQDACALTGNNIPNVADDGSDEWNTASAAYEAALPYAIEGHDWKFATTVATLERTGTPADDQFTDAYNKPPDLLHLIWVRLNLTGDAQGETPVNYQILDNQIILNASGGTAGDNISSTPGVVTCKYVRSPDPTRTTPTFMMAMRAYVMSGLYRGLHEDVGEAARLWAQAEQFLAQARSRSDQEAPKRTIWNSRAAASRRIRRPWPPTPGGWSGTGTPG